MYAIVQHASTLHRQTDLIYAFISMEYVNKWAWFGLTLCHRGDWTSQNIWVLQEIDDKMIIKRSSGSCSAHVCVHLSGVFFPLSHTHPGGNGVLGWFALPVIWLHAWTPGAHKGCPLIARVLFTLRGVHEQPVMVKCLQRQKSASSYGTFPGDPYYPD